MSTAPGRPEAWLALEHSPHPAVRQLHDYAKKLESTLAAERADAARYRFLRDNKSGSGSLKMTNPQSQSVAEAAGRLRRYYFGACLPEDAKHDRFDDAEVMVRAELDSTPICRTELRKLGFTRPMAVAADEVYSIQGHCSVRKDHRVTTWAFTAVGIEARGLTTMGELRTLLRLSTPAAATNEGKEQS